MIKIRNKSFEFKMTHQVTVNSWSLSSHMVTVVELFCVLFSGHLCVKIMNTYVAVAWWVNNATSNTKRDNSGIITIHISNDFQNLLLLQILTLCLSATLLKYLRFGLSNAIFYLLFGVKLDPVFSGIEKFKLYLEQDFFDILTRIKE